MRSSAALCAIGVALRCDNEALTFESDVVRCFSTVPIHKGEDIPRGTLRAIERDLEPCLGKGWLAAGR